QRVAQPCLVGAALRGRNSVAIGMAEALVLVIGPRHGPFDAAAFGEVDPAEERLRRQHRPALEGCGQKIAYPAREMETLLGRNSLRTRQCGIATPPDLQAAEEICL